MCPEKTTQKVEILEQKEQLERLEPRLAELLDSIHDAKNELRIHERQIQEMLFHIAISREIL